MDTIMHCVGVFPCIFAGARLKRSSECGHMIAFSLINMVRD